jgi:hypothetical protein
MIHIALITKTSTTRPAISQITYRDTETINTTKNQDKTKTQTKEAHLGITIRGVVPASGRQGTTPALIDLGGALLRAGAGWSTC